MSSALPKSDKILIAMHEKSSGSTKPLKYEDIVVAAFEKYPQDFSLRGYSQYPDSSDIHKPLYGPLKNNGYIRNANKLFSLTERGISRVEAILKNTRGGEKKSSERLRRDEQGEIDKLLVSDAFRFFQSGEQEKILDSDFYAFFGVTVRTGKNEFQGRIATVNEAITDAKRILSDDPRIQILSDLHDYLLTKFQSYIPQK